MDDVRLQRAQRAGEAPGGRQVHLAAWRKRQHLEVPFDTVAQLALRVGHHHDAVPARAEAARGQQHLVLAAAPAPRRVDLESDHRSRVAAHNRANFRNT